MLPPHLTEALNNLLAEERASVECEVAFTSGAGEYPEREAFTTMGARTWRSATRCTRSWQQPTRT